MRSKWWYRDRDEKAGDDRERMQMASYQREGKEEEEVEGVGQSVRSRGLESCDHLKVSQKNISRLKAASAVKRVLEPPYVGLAVLGRACACLCVLANGLRVRKGLRALRKIQRRIIPLNASCIPKG